MRRLMLTSLLLLAFPASASAAGNPLMWQTPSGNIACASFGTNVRCDMRELGNPPAPHPEWCDFDYGNAFGITKNGKRGKRLCISDAVGGPGTPTLQYGTTWRRNGFRCRVRRSGVRCTNPGGHGFLLRRGRQTLF